MKTEALMFQFSTNDPSMVVGEAERRWRFVDSSSMMLEEKIAKKENFLKREWSGYAPAYAAFNRGSRNVPRLREIEQHSDSIIAHSKVKQSNQKLPPLNVAPFGSITAEWAGARAALAGWATLQEDWDDDGAAPLPAVLLEAVQSFIEAAEKGQVAEPKPYISSDGEVGFHWEGKARAVVSFLTEDRFLAYVGRLDGSPVRIAGPLELATASKALFEALAAIS
jgi:hypothetical protein